MKPRIACVLALAAGCVATEQEDRMAELAGVYHLPSAYDTVNLQLHEDGTFDTMIFGCDFGGGSSGRWALEGGAIVLRPEGDGEDRWAAGVCPSTCFAWFSPTGMTAVTEVLVHPADGDTHLVATFHDEIQDEDLVQDWEEGGRCLVCGEGEVACDDPLSDPTG